EFPDLHIHAYSPPEINFLARRKELSLSELLDALIDAGLNSIPGGGAEILVDRVRRLIAPAKDDADAWLEVMRCAHSRGIFTTATMMFGQVETVEERIEHLDRLRCLQDESLARREQTGRGGAFTSFTCWPFQTGNTRLARRFDITPVGAVEQLKMTAFARLYLDNIPNHQASWITQGPQIGQLQLRCGCNDMGSLMIEENVVAAAGTTFRISLEELKALIRAAGFTPRQRDFYYRFL
ncbi:MAG: dehypoxanthine futalosine cyclase, partial [Sedimentisphaerales bacterium]|nr:dehypoxanthine futalosine cyclase [Sedimentisphaerales bacterium]